MAFRIHHSVVRGEIDNRVKGVVCGTIWVQGRSQPVLGHLHQSQAGLEKVAARSLLPDTLLAEAQKSCSKSAKASCASWMNSAGEIATTDRHSHSAPRFGNSSAPGYPDS